MHRLTQHAFTFEPLPDLSVKGKAEPLAVYRLLGSHHAPGSARGLEAHGLAAALVGRDGELEQLVAGVPPTGGGRGPGGRLGAAAAGRW